MSLNCNNHIILDRVFFFIICVFFVSCQDRLDELRENTKTSLLPISVAESINTKYVDSGRLKSVLTSSKMINFSNQNFPFYEFPEGLDLTLLSKKNDTSNVMSNTAVVFIETDIIDLRGDVVLITSNQDTLFTDQLYYDQKLEWLFTDFPVRFRTKNYITDGNGFDSNQDFTNAQVIEVTGRIFVED
tara:strand:- start:82 stop:642 length:561 start_codon:yes stop_codon:yes gene_type:complete